MYRYGCPSEPAAARCAEYRLPIRNFNYRLASASELCLFAFFFLSPFICVCLHCHAARRLTVPNSIPLDSPLSRPSLLAVFAAAFFCSPQL
ncbi:hypothetical protein M441DRAFT_338738 [Trichoderma asperellum CBS 433.97]|uniref:Uncharacterized protein n=1 Tax=Trichoderma asperellum (strain ATCC 204424 / CBS 433.97 / NBRC 101777) TaxID=1042311 RepID=A0A2T3ZGQ7_TRIA4|nr:hypothetical protein M441DRAFT_338738 [Trichoderma asperellum CBS 433.97]PTB43994.1 hypothetical protein M441DRAFT_338738 [Trichoderma asperellum CBS 433.97]